MKIEIVKRPKHVCAQRAHHVGQHRKAFKGVITEAEEDPSDSSFYLVTIRDAIMGLIGKHKVGSVEAIYWQMQWRGRQLSDHIRISKHCCKALVP